MITISTQDDFDICLHSFQNGILNDKLTLFITTQLNDTEFFSSVYIQKMKDRKITKRNTLPSELPTNLLQQKKCK
jgi:hypothetical protein